jgi:hypothetical protein
MISAKVASANATTSEVSPFFNIEVAVSKRLEIALDLSTFPLTCWAGFIPCINEVSSFKADAEISSGAASRNMIKLVGKQAK